MQAAEQSVADIGWGVFAAEGSKVTLVSTDVEGSTELWEWDKDTLSDAFALHDRILRSQLTKYFGYEVCPQLTLNAFSCHKKGPYMHGLRPLDEAALQLRLSRFVQVSEFGMLRFAVAFSL